MKKYKFLACLVAAAGTWVSCNKNKDTSFSDFDYQTVYFASQFPVRTVVLGEDRVVDNTLDAQGKVSIKATMGGVRENKNNVLIDVSVNDALCNNLYFTSTGAKVTPLPATYYKLAANQINIPSGTVLGGVEVQLTDAFFADPLALVNNYVIPLQMNKVQGADSILRGIAATANPNPVIDLHWTVKPRDYVLYAVKFINPWHGNYLRRGVDVVTGKPGNSNLDKTITRHKQYVEQDEVKKMTTQALSRVELPLVFQNSSGTNIPMNVSLTFDAKGEGCNVAASGTGFTATGTGKFVKRGEKNSWGNVDRDAIYLEYTIDHPLMQVVSKDTLVIRDRAVAPEYFAPVVK